jgi:hypothetical protein
MALEALRVFNMRQLNYPLSTFDVLLVIHQLDRVQRQFAFRDSVNCVTGRVVSATVKLLIECELGAFSEVVEAFEKIESFEELRVLGVNSRPHLSDWRLDAVIQPAIEKDEVHVSKEGFDASVDVETDFALIRRL